MRRTILLVLAAVLAAAAPGRAPAADLFYMDHDPLTNTYTGAVGPLVLSGEIVPGDYDRLLQKIAGNQPRFFEQNKFIIASEAGDLAEAMRIADLIKALYAGVSVGPLTGRCLSTCFLIYAAATQRTTDGAHLIGLDHPAVDAALADKVQAYLKQNDVPQYLVDEMFRSGSPGVYLLSERDEATLGPLSPAFKHYLADKCHWDETLERDVYAGRRPFADLKNMSECRNKQSLIDAKKALVELVKVKTPGAPKPKAPRPGVVKPTPAKPTPKTEPRTEPAAKPAGAPGSAG
jgi:hypothetical protein